MVSNFEFATSDSTSLVENDYVDLGCVLKGFTWRQQKVLMTSKSQGIVKGERITDLRHMALFLVLLQSRSLPNFKQVISHQA